MAIASRIFNVKKQLDDGWYMSTQKVVGEGGGNVRSGELCAS